jgi:hypothetical protein
VVRSEINAAGRPPAILMCCRRFPPLICSEESALTPVDADLIRSRSPPLRDSIYI